MGYYDSYNAVVNGLKTRLQTVADLKLVVFGEKDEVAKLKYPCAFIIPDTDDISGATVAEDQHDIKFEVILIIKNYRDVETGLDAVMQLVGSVYDSFKDDQQLGGNALINKISQVTPGYSRTKSGVFLHWASIGLSVMKFM